MAETFIMRVRTFSVIAIAIAAALTTYFFLVTETMMSSTPVSGKVWTIETPQDDTSFGGLFLSPQIDDSLPYYKYRRIEDSINRIKDSITANNKSFGNSFSIGSIGVTEINKERSAWRFDFEGDSMLKGISDSLKLLETRMNKATHRDNVDTLMRLYTDVRRRYSARVTQLNEQERDQQQKDYYLTLSGYSPRDYETKFFRDKDTYNLAYVVWYSVRKGPFDSTVHGYYKRKQIPVRYSLEDKKVLVPITKPQYRFSVVALQVINYGILFLSAYFFIGLPLQIIINISKGKAFTVKNIQRFKLMALVVLIYTLISALFPYVIRMFFDDLIPEELVGEPLHYSLTNHLGNLFLAIALFLVGKAFERGYNLQQENALTI